MKKVKSDSGRDTSRDYAEDLFMVPKDIKKRHPSLNKCLKIVLYGEPFKDSRPRVTKYGGVAMINMLKMKKVFDQLYNKYEFLQTLTILSPYVVQLNMYSKPTSNVLKAIKKDPKLYKMYKAEMIYDTAIADVDNSIKIHNDIIFEPEYRITLDDAMNIEAFGSKYLSDEPRAEFYVYYSTKTDEFYNWRIMNNHNYFKWLISHKYMMIKKYTPKQQFNHLVKSIKERVVNVKNDKDAIAFIKRIVKVLESYPSDILKAITENLDDKFSKKNSITKIIIKSCQDNKYCLDKINTISWGSEIKDLGDEEETVTYESFDRIYKELHSSM